MIEEPDLETAVFIRVAREFHIELDGDEELSLNVDDIYVIRYSAIREAVESGDVELI